MFWFQRNDERALYVDKRNGLIQMCARTWEVFPDLVADFTDLPFPDSSFAHVVFDPPHRVSLSSHSYTAAAYGRLTGDWRGMLRKGFAECFRVLRPEGTLIFKWCDHDVPIAEVLALTPERPLYGHRTGRKAQTHWIAFLKPNNELCRAADRERGRH